jgi:hypothetical protein
MWAKLKWRLWGRRKAIQRILAEPIDQWTLPLSSLQQIVAKVKFVEEFGNIKLATCHECVRKDANRCVLQYDWYNTDGDCLLSK